MDSICPPALFVSRDHCISCGSRVNQAVTGGSFSDEPLRSFIEADPWGENPMPVLADHRWRLVECSDCGQRFHRFVMSPEWNEIRFTRWMNAEAIEQFETDHGSNHDAARDVQHVLRMKDRGVSRVLDFGCGFGQFLEMCRLFGMDAHGVDRSTARRSGAAVTIHAELDDVHGSFDCITMFEVLEHLHNPLGTLKALKARLNPGGLMIVEVPDTSGVDAITDESSYRKIHPLDHINAFTPQSLVAIMARIGMEPFDKEPAFVATSLKRVAKDIAKAKFKQLTTQRYFVLTNRLNQ